MAEKRDDAKMMEEARRRFKMSVDATSENRPFQLDDVRFAAGSPDNGWQWPPDVLKLRQGDPNGSRPTLTINKLPQHIKLVTNEQRQNRPAVKVLPVDDQGDIEVAEVFSGMVRHIEVSSDADVAYDTACECQVTSGEGYFRVITDYADETSFDQEIYIQPIKNPFSVYMDPDGLRLDATGKKCKWGFITDTMSKEEFKSQWPKSDAAISWDVYAQGDAYSQWFMSDGQIRIAEYFYEERRDATIAMWSDGKVSEWTEEDEKIAAGMGITVQNKRKTEFVSIKWCKMNGVEVLEESDWLGKYVPIIRVVGNEWIVDGRVVIAGIVRNAKDAQRMGNYMESMNVEMTALAPKAPFIGAGGQFEGYEDKWDQANTVNYPYLEYNPVSNEGTLVPQPSRMAPPMASTAIIQAVAAAWENLQATVGQYNPSLGAEAQEKSGKAIIARQRQADVGTFHYIDNLGRSIRYLGCILVDLIPKIYDTKRVARIIGVDGEADTVTLDPNSEHGMNEIEDEAGAIQKIYNPNVGRYDVVVTVGPSYTTKRIEAAESMATALQGNPNLWGVIGDLYIKSQDWPGADDMAARLKKTIPPNLLADEEKSKSNDPEAKMAEVQQAAHALGQREAELNQQAEQIQAAAEELAQKEDQARAVEDQAKGATQGAQAKVDEINSALMNVKAQSDALSSQERELALKAQLAAEKAARREQELLFKVEKLLADHVEAVKNELEASEPPEPAEGEESPEASPDMQQTIMASTEATNAAVREMLRAMTADRELITDEMGNPVGSRIRMTE